MSRRKNNYGTINEFYCTECGNKGLDLPRKNYAQREAGHLKYVYCVHCQKVTNHAEVKSFGSTYTYEDFKEEFECGRFVGGERIPIKDLCSCKKTSCKFNKGGKCWNANGSYICEYRI